jgi:hypothetical protein
MTVPLAAGMILKLSTRSNEQKRHLGR